MNDLIEKSDSLPAMLEQLERKGLALPQIACDVMHAFSGGIYIRQVTLKAGTLVMGHRHKTTHCNIMLTGRMTMFGLNGKRDLLVAPVICTADPGRKVAYIHEDVLWLNLFPTEETDVEKLEDLFLDKSEAWEEIQAGLTSHRDEDRKDFDQFLWEFGLTSDYVRAESEELSDQIPFPPGAYKCKVGPSQIEGKGLMATSDIKAGETVAPARLDGRRTPAGRYTNHSKEPNAQMIRKGGDIYLVASRPIGGALGGFDGEEITIDYRQAIKVNLGVLQ
jgi:hypothetical protein